MYEATGLGAGAALATDDPNVPTLISMDGLPASERGRITGLRREFLNEVHGRLLQDEISELADTDIHVATTNTVAAYPLLKGLGPKETTAIEGLRAYLNGESSNQIGQRQHRPSFSIDLERRQLTRNMVLAFRTTGEVSLRKLLETPETLGARKEYVTEAQARLISGVAGIETEPHMRKESAERILGIYSSLFEKVMEGVPHADVHTTLSRIQRLANGKSIVDIAEEDDVRPNAIYVNRDRFFTTLKRTIGSDTLRDIVESNGEVDLEAIAFSYASARIERLRRAEAILKQLELEVSEPEIPDIPEPSTPSNASSFVPAKNTLPKSVHAPSPKSRQNTDGASGSLGVIGSYRSSNLEKSQFTPEQLALIEKNKSLVYAVVHAARLPQGEKQDAAQAGFMGLMEAVKKFDPEMGIRFAAYAWPRIHGAIIDMCREADPLPRSVRSAMIKIMTLEDQLLPDEDICEVLGINQDKLYQLRAEFRFGSILSLEGLMEVADSAELLHVGCMEDGYAEVENSVYSTQINDAEGKVKQVLLAAGMSERNVSMFWLSIEGKPLAEIGEMYGVTESRACQVCKTATNMLRAHFSGSEEMEDLFSLLVA